MDNTLGCLMDLSKEAITPILVNFAESQKFRGVPCPWKVTDSYSQYEITTADSSATPREFERAPRRRTTVFIKELNPIPGKESWCKTVTYTPPTTVRLEVLENHYGDHDDE